MPDPSLPIKQSYPARSGYLHILKARLRHLLKAGNAHAVQSPFVYRLYTEVLRPKTDWSAPAYQMGIEVLEDLRQALLADETVLSVIDYGAGGNNNNQTTPSGERPRINRTIQSIAASAAKQPAWAALLMRLVADRITNSQGKPTYNILELGTSLGLSTAYLLWGAAMASNGDKSQTVKLLTIEGDESVSAAARHNLERVGAVGHLGIDWDLSNSLTMATGNLDEVLVPHLTNWLNNAPADHQLLDLVFLDANHTYEATLRYYEQLKPYCHNGTVLVFDDIHWSAGMEAAWAAIVADPELHVTIDLYQLGIAFLRHEQVKEHFILR